MHYCSVNAVDPSVLRHALTPASTHYCYTPLLFEPLLSRYYDAIQRFYHPEPAAAARGSELAVPAAQSGHALFSILRSQSEKSLGRARAHHQASSERSHWSDTVGRYP